MTQPLNAVDPKFTHAQQTSSISNVQYCTPALVVWCHSSPAGCAPWREGRRQGVVLAAVNSRTTTST